MSDEPKPAGQVRTCSAFNRLKSPAKRKRHVRRCPVCTRFGREVQRELLRRAQLEEKALMERKLSQATR